MPIRHGEPATTERVARETGSRKMNTTTTANNHYMTHGTCQFCGRTGLKLGNGGNIPRHGFRGISGGGHGGACSGSGYKPYEVSRSAIQWHVERLLPVRLEQAPEKYRPEIQREIDRLTKRLNA